MLSGTCGRRRSLTLTGSTSGEMKLLGLPATIGAPGTTTASKLKTLIDAGPSVVIVLREHGRGKGSGAPFDQELPQLWTFRGDRIIRWGSFQARAEALEAAGVTDSTSDEK